ncbi:MAG: deazaflavin-dependent nitroreductase family protein [Marmoricola sp.]|nr:deazaflavin-dependent nitroreductase family protein [Marmoricola sp.]
MKEPPELNSERVRRMIKQMASVNVWLYRHTGGRVGGNWRIGAGFRHPVPICLLEHTGRKSGQLRTTPLVYLLDGENVVVVASQAGRAEDPQWYLNIRANPAVGLQLRNDHRQMRARTANPEERAELWPRLVALYADYASYQSWCPREIPVVICEPR